MSAFSLIALLLCACSVRCSLVAGLWLPQIFSSNMVLQRAPQQATVWGSAAEGSSVSLSLNDTTPCKAVASQDGQWSCTLPAMQASTGNVLTVSGDGRSVVMDNVAFGDVYVCSGQSNMEISVGYTFGGQQAIDDSLHFPLLRLFTIADVQSAVPLNDTTSRYEDGAQWVVSQPRYINGTSPALSAAGTVYNYFSAVCYYYGRALQAGMGGTVAVGLIESCWAGTRVEAWMSADGLIGRCGPIGPPPTAATVASPPSLPSPIGFPETASVLFNGMIAPITRYAIRGVVWYQGESNIQNATDYQCRFPAMIDDWRQQWRIPLLPFYFAVIAAYREGSSPSWMDLRAAQIAALSARPAVGLASAHDLGDEKAPNPIHPRNKSILSERLARVALTQLYGSKLVSTGPQYSLIVWPSAAQAAGNQSVQLLFDSNSTENAGLILKDTSDCIACCADWKNGSPVTIQLRSGSVVSAVVIVDAAHFTVTATVYVSDGDAVVGFWLNYTPFPECALYNDANLPHLPFRVERPTSKAAVSAE